MEALWRLSSRVIMGLSISLPASAAIGADLGAEADFLAPVPESHRAEYARLLENPTNLAILGEMARRFEEDGLYAEAARLLRRVLLLDETQVGTRLRLALLEHRLGNNAAALAQLDQVDEATLPETLRTRAAVLRREVTRSLRSNRIDGVVKLGMSFQTNANAAPDDDEVTTILDQIAPGQFAVTVSPAARRKSDHAAVADLIVRHRYDPDFQSGMTFETRLRVRGEVFDDVHEFDNVHGRLDTGPRFQGDPSRPDHASVRPYAFGEVRSFDGEIYSWTPGLGLEGTLRRSPRWQFDGSLEIGWRLHGPSADVDVPAALVAGPAFTIGLPVRDADDLDGLLGRVWGAARWRPVPQYEAFVRPVVEAHDSRDDAFSRIEGGLDVGITRAFAPPFANASEPALVSASAGYGFGVYDKPNLQISTEDRREHQVDVSLYGQLPVWKRVFVYGGVSWQRDFSTIDTYDRTNVEALLGVGARF